MQAILEYLISCEHFRKCLHSIKLSFFFSINTAVLLYLTTILTECLPARAMYNVITAPRTSTGFYPVMKNEGWDQLGPAYFVSPVSQTFKTFTRPHTFTLISYVSTLTLNLQIRNLYILSSQPSAKKKKKKFILVITVLFKTCAKITIKYQPNRELSSV